MNRITIIRLLLKEMKDFKLYMIINCIVCFVYEFIPLFIIMLVSYMTGKIMENSSFNHTLIISLLIFSYICSSVSGYIETITEHDIAYRILYSLRFKIYSNIELNTFIFKKKYTVSQLTSIVSSDMEIIEWFYAHTINIFIAVLLIILITSGVLLFIGPVFALNSIVWTFLFLLLPFIFRRKSDSNGIIMREKFSDASDSLLDLIQGLRELISFNYFKKFQRSLMGKFRKYEEAKIEDSHRRSLELIYVSVVNSLMLISTLILTFTQYSQGKLKLQYVLFPVLTGIYSSSLVNKFLSMSTQFSKIFAASKRVLELLRIKNENDADFKKPLSGKIRSIEFKNVYFSYPESRKYQLQNINFKIVEGKNTVICGESGSGKTTILNLILGNLKPESGEILINGINLEGLSPETIHKEISLVNQNSYIFNGTLGENISLGNPEKSKEEIKKAAGLSGLDDYIKKTPEGLEVNVGERALKLSGGEKQRLSIARAILKDSSCIILDEAQSNLENKNEINIIKNLNDYFRKKILISVSHRPITIRSADEIIVLDGGKVAATGSFENMMKEKLFREKIWI